MFYSRRDIQPDLRETTAAFLDDACAVHAGKFAAHVLHHGFESSDFGDKSMVGRDINWYRKFMDSNVSVEAFRLALTHGSDERTAQAGYFVQTMGSRVITLAAVSSKVAEEFSRVYARATPEEARYAARTFGMEVLMSSVLREQFNRQKNSSALKAGMSAHHEHRAVPLFEALCARQGLGFSFELPDA